jgi:hypothetical protein
MNKELFDSLFGEYLLQPDFIATFVKRDDIQEYFEDRFNANYETTESQTASTKMSLCEVVSVDFKQWLEENKPEFTDEILTNDVYKFVKPMYEQLLFDYITQIIHKFVAHEEISVIIDDIVNGNY